MEEETGNNEGPSRRSLLKNTGAVAISSSLPVFAVDSVAANHSAEDFYPFDNTNSEKESEHADHSYYQSASVDEYWSIDSTIRSQGGTDYSGQWYTPLDIDLYGACREKTDYGTQLEDRIGGQKIHICDGPDDDGYDHGLTTYHDKNKVGANPREHDTAFEQTQQIFEAVATETVKGANAYVNAAWTATEIYKKTVGFSGTDTSGNCAESVNYDWVYSDYETGNNHADCHSYANYDYYLDYGGHYPDHTVKTRIHEPGEGIGVDIEWTVHMSSPDTAPSSTTMAGSLSTKEQKKWGWRKVPVDRITSHTKLDRGGLDIDRDDKVWWATKSNVEVEIKKRATNEEGEVISSSNTGRSPLSRK